MSSSPPNSIAVLVASFLAIFAFAAFALFTVHTAIFIISTFIVVALRTICQVALDLFG